jgi:hypothetical protein
LRLENDVDFWKMDKTLSFYDEVVVAADLLNENYENLKKQYEETVNDRNQMDFFYKERIVEYEKKIQYCENVFEQQRVEVRNLQNQLDENLKENDFFKVSKL